MAYRLSNINYWFPTVVFIFYLSTTFNSLGAKTDFKQLNINKTDDYIIVDGIINEAAWKLASKGTNFANKWPSDTGFAASQTEVYALINDEFLYFAFICHEESDKTNVIQTLKRDRGHWNSDAVAVTLDPLNQKASGYMFGVNVGGAQTEGLISADNTSFEWDSKWYSAVQTESKKWTVEIAIPLKTIRYNDTNLQWGLNFIRNDLKRNEYSVWYPIPLQFRGTDLGYMGILNFLEKPKVHKSNIVLIPYLTGSADRNFEDGDSIINLKGNAGLDAKIAVTPTLNLDVTINPDFSQVDVDQQVTNLTRFNIFFPERRNFFLENNDIFGSFGIFPVRPFFSRGLGINDGNPVPILFGLRLSGNINKNWRLGFLDIQTNKTDEFSAQNYSVFSLQKRVLKRSTIKMLFINRQAYTKEKGFGTQDYNRVGALEFNYLSKDGKWSGNAGYQITTDEEQFKDRDFNFANIVYRDEKINTSLSFNELGENYVSDVGFVQRLNNYDALNDTTVRIGYYQLRHRFNYQLFDNTKGPIQRKRFFLVHNAYWRKPTGQLLEYNAYTSFSLDFKNRSGFEIGIEYNYANLPVHTDIVGIDEATEQFLPPKEYNYINGSFYYGSDSRKPFSYEFFTSYGSFYNGTRLSFGGSIAYRTQPWGNFSVDVEQNIVKLPENFGESTLTLIRPTIDISFTNNIFWTNYIQFNTQNSIFSINSRFQWRYLPMSDMFLVYTDNYLTDNFVTQSRAIVFKISYWLNI